MPAPTQQQQQLHQQPPWWSGPLQGVAAALQGVQHNAQRFAEGLAATRPLPGAAASAAPRLASVTMSPLRVPAQQQQQRPAAAAAAAGGSAQQQQQQQQHQAYAAAKPVSKEELGKATWVFLHTLAAQFPERPTRQQQRDARQLIDSLTRIYPCADCAQHFRELVRRDPPDVGSGRDFERWMCRTHNAVNRRLGKAQFNCDLVAARWAPLDCDEHNSCDMTVGRARR